MFPKYILWVQEIEFIKQGSFTPEELEALVSALRLAGPNRTVEQRSRGNNAGRPSTEKSVSSLEAMGVRIYGVNEPNLQSPKQEISWDNIAGYSEQKRYGTY